MSPGFRCSVSTPSDFFTHGSLVGSSIEPDTSTRNTRCAGLRASAEIAFVATPTRSTYVSFANGSGAASIATANGEPVAGGKL